MSLRSVAGAIYRKRSSLTDKLNRLVDFNEAIPAFANVKHFVNADAGRPDQDPAVKVPFYRYVNDVALKNVPIDYLEFGVFRGWSLKHWLDINRHPDSRFFGFDSFKGLPERWMDGREAGHFNRDGQPPQIDDPRVKWVIGLFQETLPGFLKTFRNERQVVVHIDCDLYGGTMFALSSLHTFMPPGTVVFFDEFYDVQHEFAGFYDYTKVFMREWEAVAYRDAYVQAAVRLL